MTDTSSRAKALYATEKLGANKVYEECLRHRNNLDGLYTELATAKDRKRDVEHTLDDLEMEVRNEEASKHPGMSATAMREHVKIKLASDDSIREAREALNARVSDIEGLELDIRLAEKDITIAVARMGELGGLLSYLAAIMQSESTKETKETE